MQTDTKQLATVGTASALLQESTAAITGEGDPGRHSQQAKGNAGEYSHLGGLPQLPVHCPQLQPGLTHLLVCAVRFRQAG